MRHSRQHVAAEQIGLGRMGVAGQDEGIDAERLIGLQLGQHLVGIADNGGAAARAGAADAGPEVVLDIAICRAVAQLGLAGVRPNYANSRSAAVRASASVSRTTTWTR
jgi:hypothetical protein